MNEGYFAVIFALAAGFGVLWSLTPASSLSARIEPQLVFRSNARLRVSTADKLRQIFRRSKPAASVRQSVQAADFGLVLGSVLSNGETVVGALDWVSQRLSGSLGRELRKTVMALHTGSSLSLELARMSAQPRFSSFAETLERVARAAEFGTDVAEQVQVLADASLSSHRVDLLARQSRTELRMLLPLVFLILPTTILFAVYPSLLMLQLIEI